MHLPDAETRQRSRLFMNFLTVPVTSTSIVLARHFKMKPYNISLDDNYYSVDILLDERRVTAF